MGQNGGTSRRSAKAANLDPWLNPVRAVDPRLADIVTDLHHAICTLDDVCDRAVAPEHSVPASWRMAHAVDRLHSTPHAGRMMAALAALYGAECTNHEFLPSQRTAAEEIAIWQQRAALIEFYFAAWTCVDPAVDTLSHWAWIRQFALYCLRANDCRDWLSGRQEDLRLGRRNIVVLETDGTEGYIGWRARVPYYERLAREMLEALRPPAPHEDPKMQIWLGGQHA